MLRTSGISPKAILAAVLPTVGGVVAVGLQWVATGEFDRAELATALSAVMAALLAFAGAYAGRPGAISEVASSDALLDAEAVRRLRDERGYNIVEVCLALLTLALAVWVLKQVL